MNQYPTQDQRTSQHESTALHGEWSVWRDGNNGTPEMIESDLPEEIARDMVADHAAEGETVWMELTAPTPE